MYFEVYSDSSGIWRWRLVARNGRLIARSAQAWSRKALARAAAENMKASVGSAVFA